MILCCVLIVFSLLQTVNTFTSENLIRPGDPRITQFLADHYDCSKQ